MTAAIGEKFALARKLAHNDKSVRDEAMLLVKQWLDRRKDLTNQDYLKLWKALYYCMWMSDKPVVQHELADNIASIVLALSPDRAEPFLQAFFETMIREWAGTDHLRLDKFLALIRKMMTSFFKYVLSSDYIKQASVCDSFIMVLQSVILVKGKKDTRGIAMHIADVFVDELEVAFEKVPQDDDQDSFRVLLSLIKMIISIVRTKGLDKIIFKRLNTAILERIVSDTEAVGFASDEAEVQVSNMTMIILMNASKLAEVSFEAASDPDSADRARAPLYELRKRFIRLQAQVEDALMHSSDDADSDGDASTAQADSDSEAGDTPDVGCAVPCDDVSTTEPIISAIAPTPVDATCSIESTAESIINTPPDAANVSIDAVDADTAMESLSAPCDDAVRNVVCESSTHDACADDIKNVASLQDHAVEGESHAEIKDGQADVAGEPKRGSRRHRRRSNRCPIDIDPVESPSVKRPKSEDAGGPAASSTVQSGDVVASEKVQTPRSKSVHFSATKSVRRFNKRVPMKVAMPARELISKKPQCSALKSRH